MLEDKLRQFLAVRIQDYIFDELSDNFLKKNGYYDILHGVPIPVKPDEISHMGVKPICINMAIVIGCDINFKHRDNYVDFIIKNYGKDFAKYLLQEGVDAAARNEFEYAVILFRAAILTDNENNDAIFCYGRACADAYRQGGTEEYVGCFKAEAINAFEKTTLNRPEFDEGFYYLGFAYMNLGLYKKAQLTFESFLQLTENSQLAEEVNQWLEKLEDPVKIESGYNMIISGQYQDGINVLLEYCEDSRFNTFWPLWYYIGVAYIEMGSPGMAEAALLKVLSLSPSNIETMEELIKVYDILGNGDKKNKYEKKIRLIEENAEKDRQAKVGEEYKLKS